MFLVLVEAFAGGIAGTVVETFLVRLVVLHPEEILFLEAANDGGVEFEKGDLPRVGRGGAYRVPSEFHTFARQQVPGAEGGAVAAKGVASEVEVLEAVEAGEFGGQVTETVFAKVEGVQSAEAVHGACFDLVDTIAREVQAPQVGQV